MRHTHGSFYSLSNCLLFVAWSSPVLRPSAAASCCAAASERPTGNHISRLAISLLHNQSAAGTLTRSSRISTVTCLSHKKVGKPLQRPNVRHVVDYPIFGEGCPRGRRWYCSWGDGYVPIGCEYKPYRYCLAAICDASFD